MDGWKKFWHRAKWKAPGTNLSGLGTLFKLGKHIFQVHTGLHTVHSTQSFALTIEEQQRDMRHAMARRKSSTFSCFDIGHEVEQAAVIESV